MRYRLPSTPQVNGLERLHKGSQRLIWPNRPCGGKGYAPLVAGSRAVIEHVDDFRAVHNLESLAQLTTALACIGPRREEGLTTWQGMAQGGASPMRLG